MFIVYSISLSRQLIYAVISFSFQKQFSLQFQLLLIKIVKKIQRDLSCLFLFSLMKISTDYIEQICSSRYKKLSMY